MKNIDKEIENISNKMIKGRPAKKAKKEEGPQTPGEWLRKAYIDHDPKDGAPKVGDIGYV